MTVTFPNLSIVMFASLTTLASQCVETRTSPADGGVCGVVCPSARPLCDETSMTCVECITESDCSGGRPLCDVATHACVACESNADCATSAAGRICDSGTGACRPCTADSDCAGNVGATVCREATGECVECTPDSEANTCGVYSCSRTGFTCTQTERGSVATCLHCQADSECIGDHHCVPMTYMGTLLGTYCQPDVPVAGCGSVGGNPDFLPYSVVRDVVSAGGVAVQSCGLREGISCEALRAAGGDCSLVSGTSASDDSCGNPLVHDGLCVRPVGAASALCSYRCGNETDCRDLQICNTLTPAYCQ